MITRILSDRRGLAAIFSVALLLAFWLTMLNSKAAYAVDIPQKVMCKKNVERAAILKKPLITAQETGYYVYSEARYELLGTIDEFYCIEYYDIYGNGKIGYCLAENFDKVDTTLAIDVSHYQGDIDWNKVSKSVVEGRVVETAMIKVGQTTTTENLVAFEDERFEENIKGAISNGIGAGVYFYSTAKTVSQAEEEAKWVIEQVKNYDISAPIAFDYEDYELEELSAGTKTEVCKSFLNCIKSAGYDAVIYSNQYFLLNSLQLSEMNNYSIWAARYSTKQPVVSNTVMWQYTDEGTIDGIDGFVDLSWMY